MVGKRLVLFSAKETRVDKRYLEFALAVIESGDEMLLVDDVDKTRFQCKLSPFDLVDFIHKRRMETDVTENQIQDCLQNPVTALDSSASTPSTPNKFRVKSIDCNADKTELTAVVTACG